MPRTVRLAPRARQDLAAIRRWQMQPGSGPSARHRVDAILAAIERLGALPCLHPVGAHPPRRELSCEGHRIVYRVDPDTGANATAGDVRVLRIFGPGQHREPG